MNEDIGLNLPTIPEEPVAPIKIKSGNLRTTTKIPRLHHGNGEDDPREIQVNESGDDTDSETLQFRTETFELKDLAEAWKEFASIRRKKGKAQEQHIFVQPYILNADGFTISLELNNSLQTDILEDIKNDLIQYLRNKLQNDLIVLEAKLKKENGKKMLYTNQEKLNHMAEKNPTVKDLQIRLGLDPDY